MYGLGAADDKAGCAAAMLALARLAESGVRLRGDLLVACVADEEGSSIGSEQLARLGGIDAAIVLEPQPPHGLGAEPQGFGWCGRLTRWVAAIGSTHTSWVAAVV